MSSILTTTEKVVLGCGGEGECIGHGDELVRRPVKKVADGEVAEQTLTELVIVGMSGGELSHACDRI